MIKVISNCEQRKDLLHWISENLTTTQQYHVTLILVVIVVILITFLILLNKSGKK